MTRLRTLSRMHWAESVASRRWDVFTTHVRVVARLMCNTMSTMPVYSDPELFFQYMT